MEEEIAELRQLGAVDAAPGQEKALENQSIASLDSLGNLAEDFRAIEFAHDTRHFGTSSNISAVIHMNKNGGSVGDPHSSFRRPEFWIVYPVSTNLRQPMYMH